MAADKRTAARELAREHIGRGDPLGWFEALYHGAKGDPSRIPWADLAPNPLFTQWLDANPLPEGTPSLKVGCGLGDDAEEMARRGLSVTAFDISPTAVGWCERRFTGTPVRYQVADLFQAPPEWAGAYDFILESYTLQVLPASLRPDAVKRICSFLGPNGRLLLLCRARDKGEPEGSMPWPLTRDDLDAFLSCGLRLLSLEDFLDLETPPVRRFRAVFAR